MEGHRHGPLAARGSCWDPMALLVAGCAVCRFCCRRLANMGSVDDPPCSGQPCIRTKTPSRDGRNRTRRAAEQAQIPAKRAMPSETSPRASGGMAGTEL